MIMPLFGKRFSIVIASLGLAGLLVLLGGCGDSQPETTAGTNLDIGQDSSPLDSQNSNDSSNSNSSSNNPTSSATDSGSTGSSNASNPDGSGKSVGSPEVVTPQNDTPQQKPKIKFQAIHGSQEGDFDIYITNESNQELTECLLLMFDNEIIIPVATTMKPGETAICGIGGEIPDSIHFSSDQLKDVEFSIPEEVPDTIDTAGFKWAQQENTDSAAAAPSDSPNTAPDRAPSKAPDRAPGKAPKKPPALDGDNDKDKR